MAFQACSDFCEPFAAARAAKIEGNAVVGERDLSNFWGNDSALGSGTPNLRPEHARSTDMQSFCLPRGAVLMRLLRYTRLSGSAPNARRTWAGLAAGQPANKTTCPKYN